MAYATPRQVTTTTAGTPNTPLGDGGIWLLDKSPRQKRRSLAPTESWRWLASGLLFQKPSRQQATRPCAVPLMTPKEHVPGHTRERLDLLTSPYWGPFKRQRHKLIRDRRKGQRSAGLAEWTGEGAWPASRAGRSLPLRCHQSLCGASFGRFRPWRPISRAVLTDLQRQPVKAARLESWSTSGRRSGEAMRRAPVSSSLVFV